jgi:hypothetical protein
MRNYFEEVSELDALELSYNIKRELQKDSDVIFSYFDTCIKRAISALDGVKDISDEEYLGSRNRIERNAKLWKEKIERLVFK